MNMLQLNTVEQNILCLGMTQTQAAALAVLASNIRNEMMQGAVPVDAESEQANRNVHAFLEQLEELAIKSIQHNDGEVVLHIGTAAKQMNPLLS